MKKSEKRNGRPTYVCTRAYKTMYASTAFLTGRYAESGEVGPVIFDDLSNVYIIRRCLFGAVPGAWDAVFR